MADELTFSSPQQVVAPANKATIQFILKRRNPWQIMVGVSDEQGRVREFMVFGEQAKTLISALNTGNHTTKSEERKILEWLQQRGDLPTGTFVNVPDTGE